ncbi:MAG: GNAT family N-acetyltransferase [Lachnospiraceae bacterium]|nr:GNAT family N-acetyltransferase [Lachnospiraceae bacterium]
MKINIITEENIQKYWSILSSDDIFGINDDRLTCFIVSDENDTPAGKMVVQIFPQFIRLENLFILPEFRRRGFATVLLDFVKERPKEARLPICIFLEDDNKDICSLLEKSGFKEGKCNYNIITGSFRDFINPFSLNKKKIPEEALDKFKLSRLDQVPEAVIQKFILNSPHDEILQFPDKMLDLERFSDGSIICQNGNSIEAVLLTEETEEYTQFTWTYGKDSLAMFSCLVTAWKDLESEYGPDYRIKCLCCDEHTLKVYDKLFSKREIKQIKLYHFA